MSKKKLGYDPFDDLDILKGPDKTGAEGASHSTSQKASHSASHLTSQKASEMASLKKSRLRKMTYRIREDQLKELDRLSKKTGYDKSELARLALDYFIAQVNRQKV